MILIEDGTKLLITCKTCENERTHDIVNISSKYNEEFGEYENLAFLCDQCNSIDVYNMNIPMDDAQPMTAALNQVASERDQVIQLIQLVREDFKGV